MKADSWTGGAAAINAMTEIEKWDGRSGFCQQWKPVACQKLLAAGLIEERPSDTWQSKKGWFLTEAGLAALAKARGIPHE